MVQPKRKSPEEKQGKSRKVSGQRASQDKPSASPALAYWQSEIGKLLSQDFDNLDQAVAAVVDAAVARQPEGTNKEELFLFLTQLFEADPALKEELRRVFGLREDS